MRDERQQAELLDAYLRALQDDIDAPPPANLDPAVAAFARKLSRHRAQIKPMRDAKQRVWEQTLSAMELNPREEREQPMYATLTREPIVPRSTRWMGVALAAVMIAVLGFVLVLATAPPPSNDEAPIFLAQSTDDFNATGQPDFGQGLNPEESLTMFWETSQLLEITGYPDALTRGQNAFESTVNALAGTATPLPITIIPTVTRVLNPDDPINIPGYVPVVSAFVEIPAGTRIRADQLVIVLWPQGWQPSDSFRSIEEVVGTTAPITIPRFMPVLGEGFTVTPTSTPIAFEQPGHVFTATPIGGNSGASNPLVPTLDPLYILATEYLLDVSRTPAALTANAPTATPIPTLP